MPLFSKNPRRPRFKLDLPKPRKLSPQHRLEFPKPKRKTVPIEEKIKHFPFVSRAKELVMWLANLRENTKSVMRRLYGIGKLPKIVKDEEGEDIGEATMVPPGYLTFEDVQPDVEKMAEVYDALLQVSNAIYDYLHGIINIREVINRYRPAVIQAYQGLAKTHESLGGRLRLMMSAPARGELEQAMQFVKPAYDLTNQIMTSLDSFITTLERYMAQEKERLEYLQISPETEEWTPYLD
jgi:hypothetical protein